MRQPENPADIPGSSLLGAADPDSQRLLTLASYDFGALEDDPELVAITRFAADLCAAPIVQVTLVEKERQRFIAGHGFDFREIPRSLSLCDRAIRDASLTQVHDAASDPRFADNPLVTGEPHLRYYAGQPLVSEDGSSLGTLCVVDTTPRPEGLSDIQRGGLKVLAQAVMRRFESHRVLTMAERVIRQRDTWLRRVLDGVPQIAWSADATGLFDYYNARWSEVTGKPAPRLAEDWRPFIHPDDAEKTYAEWERCFGAVVEFTCEYRLCHADGSWRWMLARAVPVTESGEKARWFGTITDIDDAHKLSQARDLLGRELAHRIKNIFAVVVGLVSLEARRQPEHRGFADALIETLRALGRAHDFVRPAGGETRESLKGLLEMLFAPYGAGRVAISGEEAAIAPRVATPLALVFHELATNSAKYGALSEPAGQVSLEIVDGGKSLLLVWRETGGPTLVPGEEAVVPGGETGFGSRLVEMSVTGQLGGSWVRRFETGGLVVELTISREAIAPSPVAGDE